jgi:hypothetical protein
MPKCGEVVFVLHPHPQKGGKVHFSRMQQKNPRQVGEEQQPGEGGKASGTNYQGRRFRGNATRTKISDYGARFSLEGCINEIIGFRVENFDISKRKHGKKFTGFFPAFREAKNSIEKNLYTIRERIIWLVKKPDAVITDAPHD